MLPRLVGSGLSGEGALWEEWRLSPMKPVVPAPPAQAWLEPLSALAGTGPGPKVQPWKSVFGSSPETWFFWSQTLLSPHLLPGPICGSASQVLCTLLCMLPQSLSHPHPPGGLGKFAQGIYQAQDTSSGGMLLLEPPDPREAMEAQGHTLYNFTQDFSWAAAALPLSSLPPIIPLEG